jgi:hypothetical protein
MNFLAGNGWKRTVTERTYKTVIGTRRTVMDNKPNPSPFHDPKFREKAAEPFQFLRKGETVYYEIVGYENSERLIMGGHDNASLKKFLPEGDYNNIVRTFGDKTEFTYGCAPGQFKIFVYRITMTNEDGISIDLNWDAVQERCAELGVETVPVVMIMTLNSLIENNYEIRSRLSDKPTEEERRDLGLQALQEWNEDFCSDPEFSFRPHIAEGICVRVERGMTPLVLKEKSFVFKCLEGIIKDSNVVDAEEVEG